MLRINGIPAEKAWDIIASKKVPDNLKLLTKDYFNRHPIKDISAARFEYSMLLHPEVMDIADEVIPELQAKGLSFPDDSAAVAAVEQEDDTARLLRMLRKTLPPKANRLLLEKVLAREEEALPEIQRMILKAFSDSTIENCTRYLVRCRTNCSEWIIQNYNSIREPYRKNERAAVEKFYSARDFAPVWTPSPSLCSRLRFLKRVSRLKPLTKVPFWLSPS